MPKASPIQTSFNAGELAPGLEGRTDLAKYGSGCQILENCLPEVQGGAVKRPGTRFVQEAKDSAQATIIIPFIASNTAAYTIEIGNLYARFYTNGAYISGSEIALPYLTADLDGLSWTQSVDVLYIAHNSYAPIKIQRLTATTFSYSTIDFDWPPFRDEPLGAVTMYASAATGSGVTVTASAATFTSDMVGGHIKFREISGSKHDAWAASTAYGAGVTVENNGNVYKTTVGGTSGSRAPVHDDGTESDGGITDWEYLHSGSGYSEITGFTSSTVVTVTVDSRLPDSVVGGANATNRWALGAWCDEYGYPKALAFYEDRLAFAGTTQDPLSIWGSETGDYENHEPLLNADSAFRVTLSTATFNSIEWLVGGRGLFVGTTGGEFIVDGGSEGQAITPTNIIAREVETKGSKRDTTAIKIGGKVLFIQNSGRKIRELVYIFDNDDYEASDLTLLSNHISETGFKSGAYQQEPNEIVWYVTDNGKLVGMTYERSEEVFGWHRHELGGTSVSVESVAVIPHPDQDMNQVWLIVKRTINGATKRYVEYIEKPRIDTDDPEDAFYVDSGIIYDGTATTTITGLSHLEGETVKILADGATHPDKVVSSGQITLDRSASVVQVGLGYNATVQTMRINAGAADGTAQGKTKRITNVSLRLLNTGPGLFVGPDTQTLEEVHFRDSTMAMDAPVPLFTGDKDRIAWPGGYELAARVTVQHKEPLPFHLLAIMPQLVTQDR